MTVFVLDDDPYILQAVTRALGKTEVVSAEAWSALVAPVLRAGPGSVLVCDLEMPGIRGVDFCRTVRRHAPHVRIVIFSAGPLGALPEGVIDAAVPKVAGLGALIAKVHELVREGDAAATTGAPAPAAPRRAPRSAAHKRPEGGPRSRSNPRPKGPNPR
jgi:DNA-binding NarL/FixJ family response regulator